MNIISVRDNESRREFIEFLNTLEGWKTRIKNLHWAAPRKNIHVYLDELLDIVSEYEDTLAETFMGILGKMGPLEIKGFYIDCDNAWDLIDSAIDDTEEFYNRIPEHVFYKGILSETETFIHNLQKYRYLFSLCED